MIIQVIFFTLLFSDQNGTVQCPAFDNNNTIITIDNPGNGFKVTTNLEIDFSSMRILIYDYETANYFYDSWNREDVHFEDSLKLFSTSNSIHVTGLPPGDFSVITEISGCPVKQIGLGFSGFPNSAIKIE